MASILDQKEQDLHPLCVTMCTEWTNHNALIPGWILTLYGSNHSKSQPTFNNMYPSSGATQTFLGLKYDILHAF